MSAMPQIVHVGLWQIKSDADDQAVSEVDAKVKSFEQSIPGVITAYAGPLVFFNLPQQIVDSFNLSPDVSVLARGYNHMLYVIFENEASRRNYDIAKPHLELAPLLMPLMENGMDSVLSVDFVLQD
jgi:hypothetical protein